MKKVNLILGALALTAVIVSCTKEEILETKPVTPEFSIESINKTLIRPNYNVNGVIGDLYETETGQKIVLVSPEQEALSNAKLTYGYHASCNNGGAIDCNDPGSNCAKIRIGKDDVLVLLRSENGVE
jgi:hypothetical protein